MDVKDTIQKLRDEAYRLTHAANILEGKAANPITTAMAAVNPAKAPIATIGKQRTGHRRMSREARMKLSKAQKARWAAIKSQQQPQAA